VPKDSGFLQLRRGVWEHVKDGRMSKTDALCFIYIVGQADTRSGVWNGSASSLSGELGMSPRTSRDVLERLSARGYLKRFPTPGKHSCYPILVHKFLITSGEHSGEHLNARDSTSKDYLKYFPREQRVEDYGEHGVEHSAAQKRIETKDTRKKQAATPPDARFGPFLEFAKTSFEAKHKHPPTWDCFGKDGAALAGFLRRAPHVTVDVWQAHISSFFDSTEMFTLKQGGSLAYFISKFDAFERGPILAGPQKGGGNGKPTATDLARQNARSLGLDRQVN
jgi:hypothetical protein